MKALLFILSFIICSSCLSQDLYLYKDTANGFSIGMPQGWIYQIVQNPNTSIKFYVSRSKATEPDSFKVSYNVNMIDASNSSIDVAYADMLQSISKRTGYKFVSEGDTIVEKVQYKWMIEQHTNNITQEPMTAFIYLGYKQGQAYMVTFASTSVSFKKFEPLFRIISSTFRV